VGAVDESSKQVKILYGRPEASSALTATVSSRPASNEANWRVMMPVYLKDIDDFHELEKFESVLIVPCRFCPAASFAVRKGQPYFEFLRKLLKTASYERYIERMKDAQK
jgi:hypothetical protein